jgi:hypothetical protein
MAALPPTALILTTFDSAIPSILQGVLCGVQWSIQHSGNASILVDSCPTKMSALNASSDPQTAILHTGMKSMFINMHTRWYENRDSPILVGRILHKQSNAGSFSSNTSSSILQQQQKQQTKESID